jgi:hypothetical protein
LTLVTQNLLESTSICAFTEAGLHRRLGARGVRRLPRHARVQRGHGGRRPRRLLLGPETAIWGSSAPRAPIQAAIEIQITMENAKSAQTPRAGPDRGRQQRHQLEALLLRGAQRLRPVVGRGRLNCRNLLCNSSDGLVPPDDHTKLICTAALWVNPLVALRSFFVCARKLAQKYTSLPARTAQEREAL